MILGLKNLDRVEVALLFSFFKYIYKTMKQRIYIDTSVIGGYFDDEFEVASKKLFERIFNKDFLIYFSDVNEAELISAPEYIKDLKNKIPLDCIRNIEIDDETEVLA